jgi:tetratricopeptide (TPR) repeat protein
VSTLLSPPPARRPVRSTLRRLAAAIPTLPLILALVVPGATADEAGAPDGRDLAMDQVIDAVTERLREQTGLEPDAEAVVDALNRITAGLNLDGRYAEAEPIARIAREHAERLLGDEHPNTLSSASNLAGLYEPQGRYGEAEPLYRRALEASERVLGAEHPIETAADASAAELYRVLFGPLDQALATHGFFLDQSPDQRPDQPRRPLTLAGLALAGANRGLEGKLGPGAQDGLLYALEVQDLNLEGTRLAVLSACDTGRGAVDPSEGVYSPSTATPTGIPAAAASSRHRNCWR